MRSFATLRSDPLGPAATGWRSGVPAALDARDIGAYTACMADDGEVAFHNGEMAMRGRDAVRGGLTASWRSFGTLRHEELHRPRATGRSRGCATWCSGLDDLAAANTHLKAHRVPLV